MTTIDAAAAPQLRKSLASVALAALLAAGLGACGTSNDLIGGSSGGDPPALAQQPVVQPAPAQSRVAIAPVIGAPEAIAKQLSAQLGQDLEAKRVTVAKGPTDRADYTLRGYVVAAREKTATKVSYIWDVTDPTGKRVNRITGEEVASGGENRDPWAAVTPAVMQAISNKTASSLGAWLATQTQAAAVANAATSGQHVHTSALPATDGAAPASEANLQRTSAPAPTTGSIAREGPISALVPNVTGAPGDGAVSLTSALQRELSRNGIPLANSPGASTYKVEGKVKLGQSKDGKQPIQIEWFVKDPQGKQLGTVSQKNEIPEGSLDGSWGKVADAAAAAAAQGILKLLPAKGTN